MLTTVMSNIATAVTAVTAVTARGGRINGSEDAEDLMEISLWIFRHPSASFGIFRHFSAFSTCRRKNSGKILHGKFCIGNSRHCFPVISGKPVKFKKFITSPILLQKKKKKSFGIVKMRRRQWCIQNVLATAGFPEIDEGPVFGKNTPRVGPICL